MVATRHLTPSAVKQKKSKRLHLKTNNRQKNENWRLGFNKSLHLAPVSEATLKRIFLDFFWGVRIHNSFLATPLIYLF